MHRLHRHGAPVRSRLLLLLNSVGLAAVAPPGGATWDAPPMMSPLHCDSVVVQNLLKNEISTTQEKHSLTIFNGVN